MNPYEILLLLDPELPEERQGEIIARARELVERGGGVWEGQDVWAKRKLAYEINHRSDGIYHLLTFRCEPATLDEISRILRITDGVMRRMPVRRTGARPAERVAVVGPSGQDEARTEARSSEEGA